MTPALSRQVEILGALEGEYAEALATLTGKSACALLRGRDPGLWTRDASIASSIRDRLGWVDAPRWLGERVSELAAFAADVRAAGFTRVLLLGMGGSSLVAEVIQRIAVAGPGAPTLDVLDSTDPASIAAAEAASRLDRTFFLVSSKSGRTIETMSQYRYFRAKVEALGLPDPGSRFAAITDAGSPLDRMGSQESFRRVFRNPADVGGRYSALTYFGGVPAALLGLDLSLIARRAEMARGAALADPAPASDALRLAALLAAAARSGRNKLTIETTEPLRAFGYWLEQLIAESTGKQGTGVIPVEGEPLGPAHRYGSDRVLLSVRLESDSGDDIERLGAELSRAGTPWIQIRLSDRDALAGEFYKWEAATALAGAALHINPFDEPDVQESKDRTNAILSRLEGAAAPPATPPKSRGDGVEIDAPPSVWERLQAGAPSLPSLEMVLHRFFALAEPGGYLAVLAYLERTAAAEASFSLLRRAVRNAMHIPALQGYGPRYLHSIGQLFKGGPPGGIFLEVTTADAADLEIPGRKATFGQLKAAQAAGDFEALASRGRPVLRLHLTEGAEAGLRVVAHATERALAAMQGA
jgi:glucose-6-phosphate isomerase